MGYTVSSQIWSVAQKGVEMTIQEIEKGIEQVWTSKLIREWYIQERLLMEKMNRPAKTIIHPPNFCIGRAMNRWGQWNPEKKIIEISLRLLRNYEWNAVIHVLKHEMAHQLVDEYLNMNHNPHGESFKFACQLLEVDPTRCMGSQELSSMTGGDEGILLKIKKLLAKGTNEAVTEAEGVAFLQKAQELMIRYNVEIAELVDSGEFFVQHPITPLVTRWPDYFYSLGHLMVEQYHVQYIRYNSYGGAYLEYFGEPSNVDVAEYVSHVIIQQGSDLYQEFLKQHRERRNRGEFVRKASFSAFMNGLINGYKYKLQEQRRSVITKVQEQMEHKTSVEQASKGRPCTEILLASSKILREHFDKQYNPHRGQRAGCHGAGFSEGRKAGASLNINPGLRGGEAARLQLT